MAMRTQHHPQDATWIESRLGSIPYAYRQTVEREYTKLYQTAGTHEGEKRRNANLYLLDLTDQANQAALTLADEEIRRKADRLALECRKLFSLAEDTDQALQCGLGFYASAGFDAPTLEQLYDPAGIIGRLSDAGFWKRKLTRKQDRAQEAFAIRLGVVRRGRGLYVSDAMFDTMQTRYQSSIRALSALEAVNEETG